MAFASFWKRVPDLASPAAPPQAGEPAVHSEPALSPEADSAREILELLELELGAMIRQLERAANSVAGGAEATAATLSAIRERTDALTGRTNAAQSTASTFAEAADKFTQSAQGIGAQVREAGKLADEARRIFNDPAGLAAARNLRSYLIQSYARDMGNGNTVMMREIDVPIRVQGRHWGGFRTAYKL